MTDEREFPMNPWFTDPPTDPPQTDDKSKGDRGKPVTPKKRS